MIKIDKNIPIPSRMDKVKVYPFHQMEVGDSFAVSYAGKNSRSMQSNIGGLCCRFRPKKFTVRTMKNEKVIRIWRIE